ncbi:MAG: FdhF/YdeP family oxidoreductase [Candidatus Sericytochromatia bacterium]
MPKTLRYAGWVPFGLDQAKPRHLKETLGVVWENRQKLSYAWRILNHGVCDGCSLGPYGLRDNVIPGLHLCTTRLKLMTLNTMDALDVDALPDLETLRRMSGEQLKRLGRLGQPMAFGPGDTRLRAIPWEEALEKVTGVLSQADPHRTGFFVTSRGLTNETYYAVQKLARLIGTNHIDLCSRLCHAASVSGLEQTIGVAAPTCSLSDFIGTDLLVIFGSNLANNQPVTTKYMHEAKKRGTKIVVVTPMREPGLARYWVPSIPASALFGTRLADRFFQVKVGGDMAFMAGVIKVLAARGQLDRGFIDAHTRSFDELLESLEAMSAEAIERDSGLPMAEIEAFADMYAAAGSAVFVYSMGLTQHQFGTDNVKAIVNLALSRGMLGRPKTGIMPIRGHSGVQGGGECGVSPVKLPGNQPLSPENRAKFAEAWGRPVPEWKGYAFGELLQRVHGGPWDALYLVGGNLYETMPDPDYMAEAMANVRLRVHQDIVLNTGTLLAGQEVVILPGQTRYEQERGGTATSTERRIRFTPHIPGHRVGEARPEWWIPTEIGRRLFGEGARHFESTAAIREEMGALMPMYAGIETLAKEGDWLQWGGPFLCAEGRFTGMPDERARFTTMRPPRIEPPPGQFYLTTRRGKQFNSITYGGSDPLTGAKRDDTFFMGREDARARGLAEGQRVRVRSELSEMTGVLQLTDLPTGTLVGYWPRVNRLITQRYDPVSGQPDYQAFVSVETV